MEAHAQLASDLGNTQHPKMRQGAVGDMAGKNPTLVGMRARRPATAEATSLRGALVHPIIISLAFGLRFSWCIRAGMRSSGRIGRCVCGEFLGEAAVADESI